MAMMINEYGCFRLKLSVDAHIHNDACEYTYLTKLHNVFVSSGGVLVKYFHEYEAFEMV